MVWVEGNVKDHPVPTSLPRTGTPSNRPGCSGAHPAWPWTLQEVMEFCQSTSNHHCQSRGFCWAEFKIIGWVENGKYFCTGEKILKEPLPPSHKAHRPFRI